MNSLKEIIFNLTGSVQQRAKNPFISSFTIAWIINNWIPVFILLFSKTSIEERINLIINSNYFCLINCLYVPLFFAIFYVVLLPYLMWFLDFLSKKGKQEKIKIKEEEKRFALKEQESTIIIECKNEDLRSGNKEKEELRNHITELKNINSYLQHEKVELSKMLTTLKNDQNLLNEKLHKYNGTINRLEDDLNSKKEMLTSEKIKFCDVGENISNQLLDLKIKCFKGEVDENLFDKIARKILKPFPKKM